MLQTETSPPARRSPAGAMTVTACLPLDPAQVRRLAAELAAADGVPVCVIVTGGPVDGGNFAVLLESIAAQSIGPAAVTDIVVALPPGLGADCFDGALELRDRLLPRSRIHLRFPPAAMVAGCGALDAFNAGAWEIAWQNRRRHVDVMLPADALSPCPLLAPEHATAVWPANGMQVPPRTAWVTDTLDLAAYVNETGNIDDIGLSAAITTAVRSASTAHDAASWPDPVLRDDAHRNRRLGLEIVGIDELARRLQQPDKRVYQLLDGLLHRVRATCIACSRRMADTRMLPSIAAGNPARHMTDFVHRSLWHNAWQHAVADTATAHRNLIALSPWQMLAEDLQDAAGLLPLLRYADTVITRSDGEIAATNALEFRRLHQIAWAALQQRGADGQIAGEV